MFVLGCSQDAPLAYSEGASLLRADRSVASSESECPPAEEQSPIDLEKHPAYEDLPDLRFEYEDSTVHIVNTGSTIQYLYTPGSKLIVDGREYELRQFHFHAHSEHAIGGHYEPMELHLVHANAENELLVVGVRLRIGSKNATLEEARWSDFPVDEAEGPLIDDDTTFHAGELLPSGPTYRYTGSLTAPPCSSNVSWVVFQRSLSLSHAQIARFKALYPNSFRPLQPLDGREVQFGD